jgi:Fe-S cluster biogenesis protein NfuA
MIQKDSEKTLMYTEETPNPLALKFILGKPIVHEGHYLFSSLQEAQGLPVLEDILSLPGIESLLLTREFLTVTKTGDVPWSLLESIILSALEHHFSSFPLSPAEPRSATSHDQFQEWVPPDEETAEICREIESLIATRIRPAVEADGGIISFRAFQEGIVYVQLQGACSTCPMSSETLKNGIQQTLTYYIPEVVSVELAE